MRIIYGMNIVLHVNKINTNNKYISIQSQYVTKMHIKSE